MFSSIGSDMEVFAKNADGKHISLCDKIGGTKEKPLQLDHLETGFMVQEDNVALEFNIPPCFSGEEFIHSFSIMRVETAKILSELNLELSTKSSVSFDSTELTHPKALIFGCEPDYDAWKKIENKKPQSKNKNLRTAGGHIHVGTSIDMLTGIRLMDLYLGVPSILLDDTEDSIARRELYGKAGAMRPKPYGFEYRVLSNFWWFTDELVEWVYRQTVKACNTNNVKLTTKDKKDIQTCINTGDKDLAKSIINKFNINLPKTYKTC